MKLTHKKIIAKEIIVFATLLILSIGIYFSIEYYAKNIKINNDEISIKIKNISSEIKIKTYSLYRLSAPIDISAVNAILKPWERYYSNSKPKFDPNNSYEDIKFTPPSDAVLVVPKSDSVTSVFLMKRILKIGRERKNLETQLVNNIDSKRSTTNLILMLLIIAYPIRFLVLGVLWALKILKKNV